jgi:hypothetical protein
MIVLRFTTTTAAAAAAAAATYGAGVLYEYTFNREAVLNVFDLPSSDWHVYALHLAIVHMHDVELVDKVLSPSCCCCCCCSILGRCCMLLELTCTRH